MDTSTEIAIAAAAGIAIFGYFWLSNDPSDNPDMHIGPNMPCKQVLKKLKQFDDEGILDKVYDTFTPGDVKSWEEALARCEAQSNNSKIAEYMKKVVQYETCVAELPELLHEIDTGSSYSAALAKYDSSCGDLAKDAIAAHVKKRQEVNACKAAADKYKSDMILAMEGPKGSEMHAIQLAKSAYLQAVRANQCYSNAQAYMDKIDRQVAQMANQGGLPPCVAAVAKIQSQAEARLNDGIDTMGDDDMVWLYNQISTLTSTNQCVDVDVGPLLSYWTLFNEKLRVQVGSDQGGVNVPWYPWPHRNPDGSWSHLPIGLVKQKQ